MGYVSSLDHFRRYPQLIWTLLNIHHHMKVLKYDYPIVICGKTGNGKSMLLLHIVDLWYNIVIGERLTPGHIRFVRNTRKDWILNFKEIRPLDINANDEGADGLMSKEAVTRFGRDIQKLYNVFRKKLFLTPILIPDFFDLPPYFRKRIRGCIWVHKRGMFKFYTGKGLEFLNSLNENKSIKRMEVAYPFFTGTFPDYKGVLREEYDRMAEASPDKILDEMINEINVTASTAEVYHGRISSLILEGKNQNQICKSLNISPRVVQQVRKRMLLNDEL